jgi:hypothetical protein
VIDKKIFSFHNILIILIHEKHDVFQMLIKILLKFQKFFLYQVLLHILIYRLYYEMLMLILLNIYFNHKKTKTLQYQYIKNLKQVEDLYVMYVEDVYVLQNLYDVHEKSHYDEKKKKK